MVLGQKLWEGKGKSVGAGAIKSVGMEGITRVGQPNSRERERGALPKNLFDAKE